MPVRKAMRMRFEPAHRAPDCGAYHSCLRCPACCQEPWGGRRGIPPSRSSSSPSPCACCGPSTCLRSCSPASTSRSRTSPWSRPASSPCTACGTRPLPSRWLLVAAAAFGALIAVSSLANGSDAITSAGKLVELGLLGLGAAVFIDSPRRLRALLVLVVAFAAVATAWGLVGFLTSDQERQGSFMGEHDLAALATLAARDRARARPRAPRQSRPARRHGTRDRRDRDRSSAPRSRA